MIMLISVITIDTTRRNHSHDGSNLDITNSTYRVIVDRWPSSFFDGVDFKTRNLGRLLFYHYENSPVYYTEIFKSEKMKIFCRKKLIFFLFVLKT